MRISDKGLSAPPGGARRRLWDSSLTALCGGAVAFSLLLVVGIVALLAYHGTAYFWQRPVVQLELSDGSIYLGEVWATDTVPLVGDEEEGAPLETRTQLRTGNRDITGADFLWIDDSDVVAISAPGSAMKLERLEYGPFYGYPIEVRRNGQVIVEGREGVWEYLDENLSSKQEELEAIRRFEKKDIGRINGQIESLRLDIRKVELEGGPNAAAAKADLERQLEARRGEFARLATKLEERRSAFLEEELQLETADGRTTELPLGSVVRAVRPNEMSLGSRIANFSSRVREFLLDDPRESNTEGGIFPAIFGTVLMVFIMTVVVTPFGVLAAVYLREYAGDGWSVRAVRIAVNNLAGVPSIVFGVFGLGFFVYVIGGTIDQLFYPEALPAPTFGTGGILWASFTLALLTVPVVIVATEEGLAAVPSITRDGSRALGATKFETTTRVVIPAAAPGILTGVILAMARAAGEVAPLMIVGMVKLAPIPIDAQAPFLHLERKFMHLGFHIYDVGFQSPNVEATKPLVFATALLLILVVVAMNLVAVLFRNHLRAKYATSAV